MLKKELEKLISKTKEPQVLILLIKCSMPLSFAYHPFFLTIQKDKINRYEVLKENFLLKNKSQHLYTNIFEPFQNFKPFKKRKYQFKNFKLVKHLRGEDAKKIIYFLEKENKNYPYIKKYNLIRGPNSNTYAQWVINHFPQLKIKLPINCFGKNYKENK